MYGSRRARAEHGKTSHYLKRNRGKGKCKMRNSRPELRAKESKARQSKAIQRLRAFEERRKGKGDSEERSDPMNHK